jgi:hypothetical protein
MATGSYFGDMNKPKVVVKMGERGDVGSMEIVEMLFSTKGPTAGAIMVEWNVRADKPGSGMELQQRSRVKG